jgi:hypothetical protein
MVEDQSAMLPHDIDPLDSQSVIVEGPVASGHAVNSDPAIEPATGPGLMLDSLEPGTRIVVATRHSAYRFVVIDGAQKRATVTGGKMFPESTEVRIEGATAGAGVIRPGWIIVGLRMELSIGLKRITTSNVQSVSFDREPSAAPAA